MTIAMDRCATPTMIREAEERAMNGGGIAERRLIETAAQAVADVICNRVPKTVRGAVLAGRGNNGADGVATARFLSGRGYSVDVYEMPGDRCSEGFSEQREAAENVNFLPMIAVIPWGEYGFVVDAMFGIGANRELRGIAADVVRSLENANTRPTVFSVDVPSGIDALNGAVLGGAVKADVTVSFTAKKTGLVLYPGRTYAGECILADAGVPAEEISQKGYRLLSKVPDLPKRDPAGHKGTFGRILLVCGSDGAPGAAILATRACYRSGAGLCKLVSVPTVFAEIGKIPEAVVCTRERFTADPAGEGNGFGVRLIGPGLGTDPEAEKLLDCVMQDTGDERSVTVFDADALNLLAKRLNGTTSAERMKELSEMLPARAVLTPHPAELSRLLRRSVSEIAGNRLEIANEWLSAVNGREKVLVMKDAATMVVGDGTIWINETGNDGMGTAGSGDVLAGITAAVAWQAYRGTRTTAECAAAAVALHGTAGDFAGAEIGRTSLMAGDLVRYLPRAFGAPSAVEKGTDD